ncbi:MAG: hypothetical protein WCS69_11115 [Ignavibacteriaceae bacterium]|jgi:hypothetical protein
MPVNPIYNYPILLEQIKYVSGENNTAKSSENFLAWDNKRSADKITDSTKSSIVTQHYDDTLSLSANSLRLQKSAPASKLNNFAKIFNDEKQPLSIYRNPSVNTGVISSALEVDTLSGNIGDGFYLGGSHTQNVSNPKLLTITSDSIHENIKQVYSIKNKKFHGTLVNLLF